MLFKSFKTAIILSGLAFIFFSCGKDGDNNPSSELSSTIQTKWIIREATSPFKSLEFNKSAQAIVISDLGESKSYFYKVTGDQVEIKNLGKLSGVKVNGGNVSFQYTPAGSTSPQSLSGSKSTFSVGTSSETEKLCRTWKIDRFVAFGTNAVNMDTVGLVTITFTSSGTYFVNGGLTVDITSGENTYDPDETFMSWWKWDGTSGNKFCYNHETEEFSCDTSGKAEITTLNTSSLVVKEKIEFEGSTVTSITYLSPYTLSGRRALGPEGRVSKNITLPGFLKKK